MNNMKKIGVCVGKYSPPTRGHINAILQASTQVEKLYVVISQNEQLEKELYKNAKCEIITLKQKLKWLSIELSEFDHIEVIVLDEKNIPMYPYGWEQWSNKLKSLINEKIDVIFGGESEYAENGYTKYFPETEYRLYDINRTQYPISATKIRENPYQYWDYILGVAREHFVKKVLITGGESCAKSSVTKMLAKIMFTSWAREEGRYYSTKYFGGNENVFELDDFYNIAWEQRQIENYAIRTANKITFFDTDAVVTQYYCNMYLGEYNDKIETLVNPNRYDLVILLKPDVKWVDDGFRWNSDTETRLRLHEELKKMYLDRNFGNRMIEISGNYNKRLNKCLEISKKLIGE